MTRCCEDPCVVTTTLWNDHVFHHCMNCGADDFGEASDHDLNVLSDHLYWASRSVEEKVSKK
jgi:hypothetical protein